MVVFFAILALWLISLCLHEYAHARVAYSGGDHTVEEKGYLTLNPLRYLHPVASLLIPVLILAIGGIPLPGGAVWIETHRLRSRGWLSAVAAAGPLANLALCGLAALPFALGLADDESLAWQVLAFFAWLQAFAAVLNLLPIPPLDGFGVVEPWLPTEWRRALLPYRAYGFFIIIALLFFTPLGLHVARFSQAIPLALGIPGPLIGEGWKAFMEGRPWV